MSQGILLCFNSFPWGIESPFTTQLMKEEKERSREKREGVEGRVRMKGLGWGWGGGLLSGNIDRK